MKQTRLVSWIVTFALALSFPALASPASSLLATKDTRDTKVFGALRPFVSLAAAETDTPQAAATAADYRLGPGDKLRIEVYKDQQLSQSVQIRPDGKITLPLIGDVVASGLTPIDLRDRLATSLREYVNNPVVTVIVVEATAATAFVMGEVAHPGVVKLDGHVTVLQALALAGGLKDFANEKNIRVLRKNDRGTETIAFNYREAIRGKGTPVYLKPGDTVVVPD